MKTTILQYREPFSKLCWSGLMILIWLYMLVQHILRYAVINDFIFYGLLIGYAILIIGTSMVFVDSLICKTIIIHDRGLFINRRNYNYSDILSVRLNETQIYIRVKEDGTHTLYRKQFINVGQEELFDIFANLQSKSNEENKLIYT